MVVSHQSNFLLYLYLLLLLVPDCYDMNVKIERLNKNTDIEPSISPGSLTFVEQSAHISNILVYCQNSHTQTAPQKDCLTLTYIY